jgi:hypothetical protein
MFVCAIETQVLVSVSIKRRCVMMKRFLLSFVMIAEVEVKVRSEIGSFRLRFAHELERSGILLTYGKIYGRSSSTPGSIP